MAGKPPSEPESFDRPDLLDMPSGVCLRAGTPELSFRELQQVSARDIQSWDRLTTRDRLVIQRSQDKHYKVIQPGEGQRARSDRGRRQPRRILSIMLSS